MAKEEQFFFLLYREDAGVATLFKLILEDQGYLARMPHDPIELRDILFYPLTTRPEFIIIGANDVVSKIDGDKFLITEIQKVCKESRIFILCASENNDAMLLRNLGFGRNFISLPYKDADELFNIISRRILSERAKERA